MDPRTSVIQKRLKQVRHVICIASGKGGVGKSMVASHLALSLSEKGHKVGLLDLDIYGPSAHVILGVHPESFPEEHYGIIPPVVHQIHFMSVIYFTRDKPGAFRGENISNIIIELLAITQWGELEYLIIDLPPGIGDETLDIIRLLPQVKFLVVTTPSKVAFSSVEKLLRVLLEVKANILGVVENMSLKRDSMVMNFCRTEGVIYIGRLQFDTSLESALSFPRQLLSTQFYQEIDQILRNLGY